MENISLKKAKSCKGCMAFADGCSLGFDVKKGFLSIEPIDFMPTEKCYKPKTYSQYLKILSHERTT